MILRLIILVFCSLIIACKTPANITITYPEITHDKKTEVAANTTIVDTTIPIFDIPIEQFNPSEAGKKTSEQLVFENYENYKGTPKKASFNGGAVVYPFYPYNVYQVFSAPFQTVDIELEPGENIIGEIVCGDTQNFQIGVSQSAINGQRVMHVYIKAINNNKKTNLSINTDRRVYRFELLSMKTLFMPVVAFTYPLDIAQARLAESNKNSIPLGSINVNDLDFNYDIIPLSPDRPVWTPTTIFNDKKKTYIQFHSAYRSAFAPVLLEVKKKERTILNYRVVGDKYIVDSVFDHAELMLDNNAGNIIVIKRRKVN